jgi:hypothetical protein
MVSVLALLIVVCGGGIVGARALGQRGGPFGVAIGAMITGLVTMLVWGGLLLLHVVQIEPVMRWVGAYRLEQPWNALLFLTPPVVAGGAFAWVAARRLRRRDDLSRP